MLTLQYDPQFIKQQDKMLKESKLGQNTGNFDEAVMSLKAEVQMREDEIEKLKVLKIRDYNPDWFTLAI